MSFTYAKILLLSFLLTALGACTPSQNGDLKGDVNGTSANDPTDHSNVETKIGEAERKSLFIRDLVLELSADLDVEDRLPGPPEPNLEDKEKKDLETSGTEPSQPKAKSLNGVFESERHVFSFNEGRYSVSYNMKGNYLQEDGLFFESRGNLLFRPNTFACMIHEQDQVFFKEDFEEALNNRLQGIIGLKEIEVEELQIEIEKNKDSKDLLRAELSSIQASHLSNLEREQIKNNQLELAFERLNDIDKRLNLNRDKKSLNTSEISLVHSDLKRIESQKSTQERLKKEIAIKISELDQSSTQLGLKIDNLNSEISQKVKTSEELDIQKINLKSTLDTSINKASQLKEKWLGTRLGFLKKGRYLAWQEEVARGEEFKRKLQTRTNSLKIINEELSRQRSELEKMSSHRSLVLKTLQDKREESLHIDENLAKIAVDWDRLNAQSAELRRENQDLSKQIDELSTRHSEASNEASKLSDEYSEVKALVAEGEKQIEQLSFEISNLTQQKNLIKAETDKLNVQIKSLVDLGFLQQDSYKLIFNFLEKDILELLSEDLQLRLVRTKIEFPYEAQNSELIMCDKYFDSRIAYGLSKQQKSNITNSVKVMD